MTDADIKQQIGELLLVKSAIARVDVQKLWPYCPPRPAATPSELDEVEIVLGERLDARYRRFLMHAAGWPGFWQDCDLFGPLELIGGGSGARAQELLSYFEDGTLQDSAIQVRDLLPICVSRHDPHIFAMGRQRSAIAGVVIWFGPLEVERFPDFDEFFLTMIDYNRLEYQELSKSR